MPHKTIAEKSAQFIRWASLFVIAKAGSGHPGIASGCAEALTVLFGRVLRHCPARPAWPGRDRFVLSAGHGSALLYTLHHFCGYPISRDDLLEFRKLDSATPGHPERWHTPGIEATTGALGQGVGVAVGMAIAARRDAATQVWVLAGDGCLQEGVAREAVALAGHLQLGNLTLIWDNNGVTSSGPISGTNGAENTRERFVAEGWDVLSVEGHDTQAIEKGLVSCRGRARPTLVVLDSCAGKGLPGLSGSHLSHAARLDPEAVVELAAEAGFPQIHALTCPPDVRDFLQAGSVSMRNEPEPAPAGPDFGILEAALRGSFESRSLQSTRDAFGSLLETFMEAHPRLWNCTIDSEKLRPARFGTLSAACKTGRSVDCGIREHAMAAAALGLAWFDGSPALGSCFLCFTDHLRPSLRFAAMSGAPVVIAAYNDSFWLGEDGATHIPVEQLMSLRAVPGLKVFRPADTAELILTWDYLFRNPLPAVIALSKAVTPPVAPEGLDAVAFARGAFSVARRAHAAATLVATGSEVALCLEAAALLESRGMAVNVISMPCCELFSAQPLSWQEEILGSAPLVVVEAGVGTGWADILGRMPAARLSLEAFGKSASGKSNAAHFGFTADNLAALVRSALGQERGR